MADKLVEFQMPPSEPLRPSYVPQDVSATITDPSYENLFLKDQYKRKQEREAPEPVPLEMLNFSGAPVRNRREAMARRDELMVNFLVDNPEVAGLYEETIANGDMEFKGQLDDMVTARLGEFDPTINQYEVVPERKELVKPNVWERGVATVTGGETGNFINELKGRVKTIPAVMAPLHTRQMEDVFDALDNGVLGNLRAKPSDKANYIPDGLVNMYAGMVRERNPDYAKHKHYSAIKQRVGEQLAGEDLGFFGIGGIGAEQASEVVSSAIPFREDLIPMLASEEEVERREKVNMLMELADESTAGYQLTGKVLGLLGGGYTLYSNLSKYGLTRFIGVTNARKAQSFLATATAELGLDIAYNKPGYTLVLGAMMDEDQNRILSGIEAVALGSAFNLGVDFIRMKLKGKKLRNAIKNLEEGVPKEVSDSIKGIRQQVKKGVPDVPAEQMVKQPPIEMHVPKQAKVAPMTPEQVVSVAETEVTSNAKSSQRIHELDKLEVYGRQVSKAPRTRGWEPKDSHLRKMKALRAAKLKEAIKADMGTLDLESQLRANQLADDAIKQGAAKTPEDLARRMDLPEENLIDVDDWVKWSDETAPMRAKGGWSKLAYRDGLIQGVAPHMGISLLGGGLAMSQADENEAGAFMAGMMLPIAPSGAFKSFMKWASPYAKAYRARVPGAIRKGLGYVGVPFRSSIDRVSERVGWAVLRNEARSMFETFSRLKIATVYFKHMRNLVDAEIITKAEKELIHNGLDGGKRDAAIKAFGIIDSRRQPSVAGETKTYFEAYEKVIRDMGQRASDSGLPMGRLPDYFPRSISDKMYKKFLKDKNVVKDSRIQAAWKEEATALNRSLTDYEKAHWANVVINSGYGTKGKPGFMRGRKFREVPAYMRKYYNSLEESSIGYISQMTEAINAHEFLGVGLTVNRLRSIVERKEIAPGVFDKVTKQVRDPKFEGKYNYRKTIGNQVRKWIEEGSVDPKMEEHLIDLLQTRYAKPSGRPAPEWLKRMRDVGYSMTIGNLYSTITQFSDPMLSAALSSRGMGGTVYAQAWKQLTHSASRGKLGKKPTYTLSDFGIDPKDLERLLADFQNTAATTKWLRRNLKATGFAWTDVFGKQTLINATYDELHKAARSAPDSNAYRRLVSEYQPKLREEFDDFVEALRKGEEFDDNVLAAVLGRMFDQHPIGKDEMPLGYIKHPWARSMYSLKSFMLKQIDLVRKRTLNKLAEGLAKEDGLMVKDSIRDMLKYMLYFGGSVQGINWTKDFLLGREVSITDRTLDYIMQLAGLQRFHIERGRRILKSREPWGEVGKLAWTFISPPAASIVFDNLLQDAVAMDPAGAATVLGGVGAVAGGLPGAAIGAGAGLLLSETATKELEFSEGGSDKLSLLGVETGIKAKNVPYLKAKSWRYMPVFGRDVFWTIGQGEEWEAKRHKKTSGGRRSSSRRSSSRRSPSR